MLKPQFTTGALARLMKTPDLAEIVDLKVYPYGNARTARDGSISCQHGSNECRGNLIEVILCCVMPSYLLRAAWCITTQTRRSGFLLSGSHGSPPMP